MRALWPRPTIDSPLICPEASHCDTRDGETFTARANAVFVSTSSSALRPFGKSSPIEF
jgi:hypothetical protein